MRLNSHECFENYMDVSNPETIDDAERVESVSGDAYDDLFEECLAHASEYVKSESVIDDNKDNENQNRKLSATTKNDSTKAHLGTDKVENNLDVLTSKENNEFSGDIVFEGTVRANPRYGEGGGKQYFIRDFGDMKHDGRMTKIGEKRLEYIENQQSRYNFRVDTRPLTDEEQAEWAQLDEETRDEQSLLKAISNIESQIVEDFKHDSRVDTRPLTDEEQAEWAQLDEETRDEQGLSKVMPNVESQIVEDRKNPWSDQENSGGSVYPDAYSDWRELQAGEIYYQVRPVDAKYDSSYVTDEKTVDACRGENGEVDVAKLLQKLQVKPSVSEYTLTQYIYEPGEASNKVRSR